jgi:UDP-N-acetyl-2-amino-2-deoxyglucuronate dehydrogenase
MRKTRIVIVGVGLAATPHALALNDLRDQVEVVGVLGRSRERLGRSRASTAFHSANRTKRCLKIPASTPF